MSVSPYLLQFKTLILGKHKPTHKTITPQKTIQQLKANRKKRKDQTDVGTGG
jgi:hypothetical protein